MSRSDESSRIFTKSLGLLYSKVKADYESESFADIFLLQW